ncbi:MAG: hypothetical protein ACLFV7_09705 [Phycisphaerae bacterium]
MDWREAFLRQARSDYETWGRLNKLGVEYSHQLHYIQMMTEKLAKAFLVRPGASNPPPLSHRAFVSMLRVIKGRNEIRKALGYGNKKSYRAYLDSLLPIADRLERLAPALAGTSQPNPEYPWRDARTGQVEAPVDYPFPDFDPRRPEMAKLMTLVPQLLRVAT